MIVLGPFPCGAARCLCTKGGCDHLGVCPPEMRQGGEPEWAPGIAHASKDGDPACGAEQRPVDARARFAGDVVVGELMVQRGSVIDCPACLGMAR